MEKNRIRPVKAGKGLRMSYSRQKEVLQMPNLIEVQKNSYQWFLDEGLKEAFADISPITDYSGHLSLDFVDFTLCVSDEKPIITRQRCLHFCWVILFSCIPSLYLKKFSKIILAFPLILLYSISCTIVVH